MITLSLLLFPRRIKTQQPIRNQPKMTLFLQTSKGSEKPEDGKVTTNQVKEGEWQDNQLKDKLEPAKTTKPPSKPPNLHLDDKIPGLVKTKIMELSAKFNHPPLGSKPPTTKNQVEAQAPLDIKVRRPSSKIGGQGTSADGTRMNQKPGLVELVEKGEN